MDHFEILLLGVLFRRLSLSSSKAEWFQNSLNLLKKIINNETLSQYLINTEVVDIEKFESIGLKKR